MSLDRETMLLLAEKHEKIVELSTEIAKLIDLEIETRNKRDELIKEMQAVHAEILATDS